MTEVKSNFWGKYTESDVRVIREENRILEMRWEVFEGLYDNARQELEKVQVAFVDNNRLRQHLAEIEDQINEFPSLIEWRDKLISDSKIIIESLRIEIEELKSKEMQEISFPLTQELEL